MCLLALGGGAGGGEGEGDGVVVPVDVVGRILDVGVHQPARGGGEAEVQGRAVEGVGDGLHGGGVVRGVVGGGGAGGGKGFGAVENAAGGGGEVGGFQPEGVVAAVEQRGAVRSVLRGGAVVVREVETVPQLVREAAVPLGQQAAAVGVLPEIFDVEVGVVQRKAVGAQPEEGNAAGGVIVILIVVEGGHDDEGVLTAAVLGVSLEVLVYLLQALPRAAVVVAVFGGGELAAQDENGRLALRRELEAEGAVAITVARHLAAVKGLQVQQEVVQARLVARHRLVVVAEEVDDIHLVRGGLRRDGGRLCGGLLRRDDGSH